MNNTSSLNPQTGDKSSIIKRVSQGDKVMKNLLQKFISMKGTYNLSSHTNPNGSITFKNNDLTIFAQYFHNTNFEKWFKYFVSQWKIKDIISIEKTKFGLLIVEVK